MTSTLFQLDAQPDELPINSLTVHNGSDNDRVLAVFRARNAPEARYLASVIFDSRRQRLLVVVVKDPRLPLKVDLAPLVAEVQDYADVVLLDAALTASTMEAEVPLWLRPMHDTVRVYAPGADISDDRSTHPGIALDHHRPIAWNTTQVVRTTRSLGETQTKQAANGGRGDELHKEQVAHAATRQKLNTATTRVRDLRAANDSLTAALDDYRQSVFADPEIQFHHDLWMTWLRTTAEGDRSSWPLRAWDLSPAFIDSIAAQQIVDRDRVLRACVDVVTNRHAEIKSRASHRLRRSEAATSGHRERASDGAGAWSCSINVGPAAARLRWWERKDGVVELSLVTAHDDVRLSE
jgi:hypothetical protein